MEKYLIHIVQSAFCLAMLYLPFRCWLRTETFFRVNRYVLLGITVLSFILPFLCVPRFIQATSVGLPEIIIVGQTKNLTEAHFAIHWSAIATCVYLSGSIFMLIWRIKDWIRLKQFISQGYLWIHEENNVHIYCHAYPVASFSWMKQIVISEKDYQENGHAILQHEYGHIQCHHSWDMVWLSFLQTIQWFNPMVWMLTHDMNAIHEYEADNWMIKQGEDQKAYQMLLIEKACGKHCESRFVRHFNRGMVKKRIEMMTKEKSRILVLWKYIYLLPVSVALVWMFSPLTEINRQELSELPFETYRFIAQQANYPISAIKKGIQGNVVIQMSLNGQGELNSLKVVKSTDASLEEEALRIIQRMPKWKTGNEGSTQYTIPIHFRLQ